MPSDPHNAALHRRINALLLLMIIAIFGAIVLFSPKSNGSRPAIQNPAASIDHHENANAARSTSANRLP